MEKHSVGCDTCSKVVSAKEAADWWSLSLKRKGTSPRTLDVCPDCLPIPLYASGLRDVLARILKRFKRFGRV